MFDFWNGSDILPVYGFLIRAAIVYIYIFLIVKVLGQRFTGSIDALDFIFGVVIGDILGEPLTDGELGWLVQSVQKLSLLVFIFFIICSIKNAAFSSSVRR